MVFSSNIFIFIYLPIVLLTYYLLDKKYRNYFLLLASLFFYFWGEPKHLYIIIVSILVNYLSGLLVDAGNTALKKKTFLVIGIALNLCLLGYYKYLDFFINSINEGFGTNIPLTGQALPIGISFFTFQGLSYVVDLYRGKVAVQRNPLKIALYIALFPQLIAGPIVRYVDVNTQIEDRVCSVNKFSEGIYRFVVGLAKKIILANGVGIIADEIFDAPFTQHQILTLWLGILCYSLQIFFDFSGYSDMAIGLGKMFGFDFMENFDMPYISKSISEFWRRWHISLSYFFRDYVYIPLGGNRSGNVYLNVFIVFALTGLWHGAAWTFVVWGLWHGLFRIIEMFAQRKKLSILKIPKLLKHIVTLLIVMIGWVIFRSDSIQYAFGYIRGMFGLESNTTIYFTTMYYLNPYRCFIIIIALALSLGAGKWLLNKIDKLSCSVWIRNTYVIALFLICIINVMNATYNPFIYFRF